MIDLANLVGSVAALLQPSAGNSARLDAWVNAARVADLPHLHTFAAASNWTTTPSTPS
jgi:hypothetical protein